MEKSICCFIDILGYSEIICNSSDEENEKNIEKLKEMYNQFEGFNNGYENRYRNYKVRTFSDNIFIEVKLSEHNLFSLGVGNEGNIYHILSNLSDFQNTMFHTYGFFIRGAIVYGEVYSDNNIIYGKGIIEAVENEKKAKFPRIIISEELKKIIDENRKSYGGYEYWGDDTLIKLEDNEEYFLNYLNDMDYQFLEEVLENHKKLIEENLKKHKDNNRILEKYEWLKKYHNYYIKEYGVPNRYAEDDCREYDRDDLLIEWEDKCKN